MNLGKLIAAFLSLSGPDVHDTKLGGGNQFDSSLRSCCKSHSFKLHWDFIAIFAGVGESSKVKTCMTGLWLETITLIKLNRILWTLHQLLIKYCIKCKNSGIYKSQKGFACWAYIQWMICSTSPSLQELIWPHVLHLILILRLTKTCSTLNLFLALSGFHPEYYAAVFTIVSSHTLTHTRNNYRYVMLIYFVWVIHSLYYPGLFSQYLATIFGLNSGFSVVT